MVKEGQIQITKTNLGFFQDHALFKCKSVLFVFEAFFFFFFTVIIHIIALFQLVINSGN